MAEFDKVATDPRYQECERLKHALTVAKAEIKAKDERIAELQKSGGRVVSPTTKGSEVERVVITPLFKKGDRVEETMHVPGHRISGTVVDGKFDDIWRCNAILVDWDHPIAQSWVRESFVVAL